MITIALDALGVLGVFFGIGWFLRARAWAKACRVTYINIGNKRKVVLSAPLTDWIKWAKAMPHRDRAKGNRIFDNGPVRVTVYEVEDA